VTLGHLESLAPRSQELLARLAPLPWALDFYLAGSAALALYAGHRPVTDLDLMSNANRLNSPDRRDLLASLLAHAPETEVETAREGYLFVRLAGGVGVRFFYYPYPLVQPFADLAGLAVISAADLGLMKLGAIISRASRRDFVDLYLLCRELPLAGLLELAGDKFGHVRDFALQALKGLADLTEIEGDPMPRLAIPLEWTAVESWLRAQVRELGRAKVGLS
jgi:hypothetical protein